MTTQTGHTRSILLADDDSDDVMLFELALKDVCRETRLTIAENGELLMKIILSLEPPYPTIFLDLNMPRKNGIECLAEIRRHEKLNHIPIVIFSTTVQEQSVQATYALGANYYIQKPAAFGDLKILIRKVLSINWQNEEGQTAIGNFVLKP